MDTETPERAAPTEVASEVVDRVQLVNGHAVVEFNKTEQLLAQLRHRYEGVVFDLSTTKGNEAARAFRKELVGLRTGLEATRKEFKAPVLAMGTVIDHKAKTITEAILKLEEPINQQIKADEARREEERRLKAEAEAKRVAMLRERLNYMRSIAVRAVGKPSTEVQSKIDLLDRTVIGDDFCEFREEAHVVRDEVLSHLRNMLTAVQAQEAEAQRLAEEREAHARRQHFEAKLTELRGLSIGMASKSAWEIAGAIEELDKIDASEAAWAEYVPQAEEALNRVRGDLLEMLASAQNRERIATEQAAEARRLEEQRAEQQRQQEAIDAAARRQAEELEAQRAESERLERLAEQRRQREAEVMATGPGPGTVPAGVVAPGLNSAGEAAAAPAGGFLVGAFTIANDPANPEKTQAELQAAIASLDTPEDVRVIETPPLPASDAVASIKLGDLCTWAGVTMTRAFVEGFGITPTVEGRAILFTPAQRRALKAALVEHFEGLPV